MLEKRGRFRELVLRSFEGRESIQARGNVAVLGSEDRLADIEDAVQERLGGGEVSTGHVTQCKTFQSVGIVRVLTADRFSENADGLAERLLGQLSALGSAIQSA